MDFAEALNYKISVLGSSDYRLYRGATFICFVILVAFVPMVVRPQSVSSPLYGSARESQVESTMVEAVRRLPESNRTSAGTIRKQLERISCQLSLPPVGSVKLTEGEIRERTRRAYLRVGWIYQCLKCDEWHINLANGYALTTNGAIATCHHVVNPPRDLRRGALIAADNGGRVFAITEVLAANRYADACIVQVEGDHFTPLPLNPHVSAGDAVYCLSNSQVQTNDFTQGIVKRLLELPERRLDTIRGAPLFTPLRIQVSAAFGPGSSGSALLDECGNTIGHASTISFTPGATDDSPATLPSQSVFHEATSARDILSLVRSAE